MSLKWFHFHFLAISLEQETTQELRTERAKKCRCEGWGSAFFTLKRQCHDNRRFLAAMLWGENNCGHKARLRKTTFARLSWGDEFVRATDRAVMIGCPRHLREQSPFFLLPQQKRISWHCPFKVSPCRIYTHSWLLGQCKICWKKKHSFRWVFVCWLWSIILSSFSGFHSNWWSCSLPYTLRSSYTVRKSLLRPATDVRLFLWMAMVRKWSPARTTIGPRQNFQSVYLLRTTITLLLICKYLNRFSQSMRTGPDQGQIGPLLRRGFFCRERFARIFLSCPTPVLSGRISLQPITKLPSFLLKYFAVVLNYLPNERILRGEAPGYWLRPVLSTRGEQLIPADDRKEETTLPYSFSP